MIEFKWLRRLVRRNTNPIDIPTAEKWKKRLSVAYVVLAWNAFGIVIFNWYKGKLDWADFYGLKTEEEKTMPNNEYFAKSLGRPGQAKLITLSGMSVVENKEMVIEEEIEESPPRNAGERVKARRKIALRILKEKEEEDKKASLSAV